MNHLGIPVENPVDHEYRNYHWDLASILLICMSVLRLEPRSLEACSFAVGFEIGKYEFFNFVLLKNCFSYSEGCNFINFRIIFLFFSQKDR